MNRIASRMAAGALVLGLSATAARAASPRPEDDSFQQRLFGRMLAKTPIHACFTRAYDIRHLAGHPGQKVRTMSLLVTASDKGADGAPTYDLTMGVTFRRSGTHFEASGFCGSIHDLAAPG